MIRAKFMVEIDSVVLSGEEDFFLIIKVFAVFSRYLLMDFIWRNLNPLYPLPAKIGWIWPSCSGELLSQKCKMFKDEQTDQKSTHMNF